MKRMISSLLVVLMLISIMCAAPLGVSATDGEEIYDDATGYLVDVLGWGENAHVYYFPNMSDDYEDLNLEFMGYYGTYDWAVYKFTVKNYNGSGGVQYTDGEPDISMCEALNDKSAHNNEDDYTYFGLSDALKQHNSSDDRWFYSFNDDLTVCVEGYDPNYIINNEAIVDIPTEIDGYQVTSIRGSVFWDRESIVQVNIPDTINYIDGAFCGYPSDDFKIYVDDNNSYYYDVDGGFVVEKATRKLIQGTSNASITEKDNIAIIGSSAFYGCDLYDFYIPTTVTEIQNSAFSECRKLTEINIPYSVTTIGKAPFSGCSALTSITVDENNKRYYSDNSNAIISKEVIGQNDEGEPVVIPPTLVQGCKETVIPNTVEVIGESAFADISNLYKITIPENVKKIEEQAFFRCTDLSMITILNKECEIIDSELLDEYITEFPKGQTICSDKNENLIIRAEDDSTAEQYAIEAGRTFRNINDKIETTVYFINCFDWENVSAAADYFEDALSEKPINIEPLIEYYEGEEEGYPVTFDGHDVYSVTFDDYYDFIQFTGNDENETEVTKLVSDWYYYPLDGEWYAGFDEIVAPGYYLVGNVGGETYSFDELSTHAKFYEFDLETNCYELYMYDIRENDTISVVYYDGINTDYCFDEPYVVSADEVGDGTIYFYRYGCPTSEEETYIVIVIDEPVLPEAGYYLITSDYDYVDSDSYDRLFRKNGMGEYILNYGLYDGDQIKVAYFDGESITQMYIEEEFYTVPSFEDGYLDANIFFDPNGGYDPDVYHGYLKIEEYSEAPFNKGYYILGTVDGYEYTKEGLLDYYDYLRFELNDKGEFVLNIDFYNTDNDEFRVVYFDGNVITATYVEDEPYVLPKWVLGDADVYFDPDGGYEEYYGHLKFREHRGFCEYEEENHLYNDGKEHDSCVQCGKIKDELLAVRLGNYMVLTDKIEMFYNIRFADEVMDDKEAKVIFNLPNGDVLEYLVTDGKREGLQTYQYSCEVAAKEMADLIEVTVVSGDKSTKLSDYSVRKYAEDLYYWNKMSMEGDGNGAYEKQIELIKALLNYGAAAQYYFNYHTDDLANTPKYYDEATGETYEWMTTEDKVLADVSLSEFESSVTGSGEGIEYYGSALSLESGTAIKHYFLIKEGTDIPDANVYYADGTPIGTYELTKNLDLYQLKFEDIYGQELDEMYIVEIGGITINYGAFSYGAKAMEQEGAKFDTMKNVVKALRAYNQAADTYLEVVQ